MGRELHGEAAEWAVGDHLLAVAVDHLAAANWMFACVNTAEDGDQPDPPEPIPRPGLPEPSAGDDPGPGRDGPDASSGPDPARPSVADLARFFA